MPSDLKDLLDRAAERPSTEPDFAALARTGRRRRYIQRAASALAVVAVIALTSTIVLPRLRPPTVAFDTAPRAGVGTWEDVPASPLGARENGTALADGDRVIVYGGTEWVDEGPQQGDTARYDGAVYDLDERTWTTFPAPPLDFTESDIVPEARLLDDGRLMVLTSNLAAAFYDFDAQQWQVSGAAPLSYRGAAVVEWAGDRLAVWGGWTEAGERGDGAVWHPDSGWTRMARSPLAPRAGVASVWTGDRLLIWGGAAGDMDKGEQRVFADGAAYDPAQDRWTRLPDAPLAARQEAATLWTGDTWIIAGGFSAERLVAPAKPDVVETEPTRCNAGVCSGGMSVTVGEPMYGGGEDYNDGARYDPASGKWTPITPPDGFRNPALGLVGGRLVAYTKGRHATYDPGSHSWEVRPTAPVSATWDTYNVDGRTVILNSGESLGMNDHDRPRRLGGLVFNERDQRWDNLAEADTAQRSSPAVAVAGNRVFVWGGRSVTRDMADYQGEPGAWHRHDDGAVLTLD